LLVIGLFILCNNISFAQDSAPTEPEAIPVEANTTTSTIETFPAPEVKSSVREESNIPKEALKLRIRKNVIRPLGKDWYVTISGGYGIPFLSTNKRSPLKEIGDKDWYQHGNQLSVKPLFGTNGGGFGIGLAGGYMFNKYIGLELPLFIAWFPERLDARINSTLPDLNILGIGFKQRYYATQRTSTTAFVSGLSLVGRWNNGKRFGVRASFGISMPIYGKTQSTLRTFS